MNLKVGDKVKFLDRKGGGFITKIIDSRMVSVAVEGGFEIPTMISELIRIDDNEPGARFFNENYNVGISMENKVKEEEDKVEVESSDDRMKELPHGVVKNRKSEDIFLAFVPHDQKWLITGLLDVFLINNTSFDLLYNFIRRVEKDVYSGVDYGSVFPGSMLLLTTIEREEIGQWTEGFIQFLFHKNSSGELMPPFNAEISVKGATFFTEGSYRESAYIEGKGIVVKVVSIAGFPVKSKTEPKIPDSADPDRVPGKKADLIFMHQTDQREAEVDLHIHELIEDYSNLDNAEILEFQKGYFIRCLESAIVNHFRKIVVIHGVGNGILREKILDLLKEYGGIEVFDAPMQKYGVGAVEIRIPHNF